MEEAQGECRLLLNRHSPSPGKSPLKKKPRTVDAMLSSAARRQLCFDEEEKPAIPWSLCETNEARCVRYMRMCRQRGVPEEEECRKTEFHHHRELIWETCAWVKVGPMRWLPIEMTRWVKVGPMRWGSIEKKQECPLDCKNDEELSYFDMLSPELIDKISSHEQYSIATLRLEKGMERCHEEMGRLPRCDDHGTVRVDRFLFTMLDKGFDVSVHNHYLHGKKIATGTCFRQRTHYHRFIFS